MDVHGNSKLERKAFAFLLHLALFTSIGAVGVDHSEALKERFEGFKATFARKYPSAEEEAIRFDLFVKSVMEIDKLNDLNGEAVFGLTAMADRKPSEKFARGRGGHGDKDTQGAGVHNPSLSTLKAALDWRKEKPQPVTPVKNQGQCGSCWAFSTAETIESAYIMATKLPEEFSPQQIASCVESVDGCGGGDTVTAFKYLQSVPGLASRYYWPYEEGMTPSDGCEEKSCTAKCNKNLTALVTEEFYIGPYAEVKGFEYATEPCFGACDKQNLTKLALSLSEKGPVSICVNAGVWDSYKAGVLTAKACGAYGYEDLDHCVQLVGFNTSAPIPYWIVRNSWSTAWGMEGYIHLEMSENTCGLADEATLAKLNGV
eukprot:CAMPEP_0184505394 /NCGR_PEP_ID=MMETSP0113_2-20130426/52965_1 /TAXON_ID=91329 /ORGANISM="Norrisiella sphaerica, Strain BC52" /LENGTH=371 /DNA_ID=CAMNT_0026895083 /DNA_START=49 /DNA_END=1164 /DNA_ORIENTATION=-